MLPLIRQGFPLYLYLLGKRILVSDGLKLVSLVQIRHFPLFLISLKLLVDSENGMTELTSHNSYSYV